MKWIHRIVPTVIVLVALFILYYRFSPREKTFKPKLCPSLCKSDNDLFYNRDFITKHVIDRYPRFKHTPLHLIVLLDPSNDCAACLFEMQEWFKPTESEYYDVTLFLPENTPKEIIIGMQEAHPIDSDTIHFFQPDSAIAELHKFGVFKIFYSLEKGIEWAEQGSKNEEEYSRFTNKVANRIKEIEGTLTPK